MESNEINNAKFFYWTEKLLQLTQAKLTDKKLIDSCLIELNDLSYRNVIVKNDAVLLLINQLIATIQPTETSLVKNTCQFLVNLFKNNVNFPGRTSAACKRWILEALEFSEPLAWPDILLALQHFILVGQFTGKQDLQVLLVNKGILKKVLNIKNSESLDYQSQGIDCLQAILLSNKNCKVPLTNEHCLTIKNIAVDSIALVLSSNINENLQNKVLSSCLRVLRILVECKLLLNEEDFVGEVMGIIQVLMFHGIKGYFSCSPGTLLPAAMNLPERAHVVPKSRHSKSSKGKPKKQAGKESNTISQEIKMPGRYSSDSETSDCEVSNFSPTKVRLENAQLFHSVADSFPARRVFGFWPQVVANDSKTDSRLLTRCILKETSCKVKQSLLSTLAKLLSSCRAFLVHADDSEHHSFVSFFNTVGQMLRVLHQTLCLCLNAEKNVLTLLQSLKCISALVQATPYARLKPGLALKVLRNVKPYLQHNDPTLRVAALSAYESLASNDPLTPEILEILARKNAVSLEAQENKILKDLEDEPSEEIDLEDLEALRIQDLNTSHSQGEKNMCFLLSICLKNVANEAVSTPVRLQSLKVIGKLALNAKSLILPHVDKISRIIVALSDEQETQVVLHGCRVLETMAGIFSSQEGQGDELSVFWSVVFEPLVSLVQHSQSTLRAVACDCLGAINSEMLTQLPRQKVILVITVLFGAVRDPESAVRAAGLRALGMLVALPTLEEDAGFLMDLVDTVCLSMDDQNLGVRVKAAWALANLCDCLIRRRNNQEVEPVPLEQLLPKMYELSVRAKEDNDKVKCNAVRSLGTILHLCSDKQILKDTSSGLETLITCAATANDMKVQWNACHALGLVLSQDPDKILPPSWREQVFPALCTFVCHSPNFKVRTNAAWALACCRSYGKYMASLWKHVVHAFGNSEHVPSYAEYPHRDALVEQLCLTLSHLAVHTNVSDLRDIWAEISYDDNCVATYMHRFQKTTLPEKLGNFIEAKARFEEFAQNAGSLKEQQIAKSLATIFERNNNTFENVL